MRAAQIVLLLFPLGLVAQSAQGQRTEHARASEGAGSSQAARESRWDRFFLEVGYSFTLGSAHPHMRAASLPPLLAPGDDPQTDGLPQNDAYIAPGTRGCQAPADEYCVRVDSAGLAFAHGFHLGFGAYITERFALSARARVAPMAGGGPLSNVLLGLRAHVRLTQPRQRGFHASLFVGGSAGQIQLRPQQRPTGDATSIDRPYVRTGLGGAELGLKLGYRFTEQLGVFLSPEGYLLFPSQSGGAQATLGLDFTFGTVAPSGGEQPEEQPEELDEPPDEGAGAGGEAEAVSGDEAGAETGDSLPTRPDDQAREEAHEIAGFDREPDGSLRARTTIRFEKNSHRLDPSSGPALDELARAVRENPDVERVHLEGHADERGPAAYNLRLSERRAESVRRELLRRGLTRAQVTTEGHGWNRPLFPHASTEAEHEANRRVEFVLIVSD